VKISAMFMVVILFIFAINFALLYLEFGQVKILYNRRFVLFWIKNQRTFKFVEDLFALLKVGIAGLFLLNLVCILLLSLVLRHLRGQVRIFYP
jgi:hypothetical protein